MQRVRSNRPGDPMFRTRATLAPGSTDDQPNLAIEQIRERVMNIRKDVVK